MRGTYGQCEVDGIDTCVSWAKLVNHKQPKKENLMNKNIFKDLEELIDLLIKESERKSESSGKREEGCTIREGDWVSFRVHCDFGEAPVVLRCTGLVTSIEADVAKVRPVSDVREDAVILGFSRTVPVNELERTCPPNKTVIIPPTK